MERDLVDWALVASAIASSVLGAYVAFHLLRRGNLEQKVENHGEAIAGIKSFLRATTSYRE